jgi:dynein light chain LC8-type
LKQEREDILSAAKEESDAIGLSTSEKEDPQPVSTEAEIDCTNDLVTTDNIIVDDKPEHNDTLGGSFIELNDLLKSDSEEDIECEEVQIVAMTFIDESVECDSRPTQASQGRHQSYKSDSVWALIFGQEQYSECDDNNAVVLSTNDDQSEDDLPAMCVVESDEDDDVDEQSNEQQLKIRRASLVPNAKREELLSLALAAWQKRTGYKSAITAENLASPNRKSVFEFNERNQNTDSKQVNQAMDKCQIEKDIATSVKKKCDEEFGGTWHVICGRNFGCSITHDTKFVLFFQVDLLHVMIFKSLE